MKIEVDRAAVDYINEKGGIVNVDLFTTNSCCAGITEPVINFDVPKALDQFDKYIIDGITVYVSKFIHLKDDSLKIALKKLFGIKNLSLLGIRML